jgi:glyoxylase-like metal-dependent hydrolase (beta-lactamase superfamily II)
VDTTGWTPERIRAGEWTLTALRDGSFRLDGGAMWGVVPATLWRDMTPPDEDNTIPLALRPFLAERGEARVLVEPGIGGRWGEKERRIYRMDHRPSVQDCLAALGLAPDSITHVVATHCHWDHLGAQVVERDGVLVPTFPRARHFAPLVEIESARSPVGARAASYRREDVTVIEEHGLLEGVQGTTEILPGLTLHVLGGHSDGVSVITFGEAGGIEGARSVFWSDVVPTRHHIQPPYVMAYDLDAGSSFHVRSEWIARAADAGWIGLFYHDFEQALGRIVREGRRYRFEALRDDDPCRLALSS